VGVDDHSGGNMSVVHQLDLVLVLALVVGEGASLDSAVADGLIVQERETRYIIRSKFSISSKHTPLN